MKTSDNKSYYGNYRLERHHAALSDAVLTSIRFFGTTTVARLAEVSEAALRGRQVRILDSLITLYVGQKQH